MEINHDLIKEILEKVSKKDKGSSLTFIRLSEYKGTKQEYTRLMHHYKILFDKGLIEGDVAGGNIPNGVKAVDIHYTVLTPKGQRALELIKSGAGWNIENLEY